MKYSACIRRYVTKTAEEEGFLEIEAESASAAEEEALRRGNSLKVKLERVVGETLMSVERCWSESVEEA